MLQAGSLATSALSVRSRPDIAAVSQTILALTVGTGPSNVASVSGHSTVRQTSTPIYIHTMTKKYLHVKFAI